MAGTANAFRYEGSRQLWPPSGQARMEGFCVFAYPRSLFHLGNGN